MGSSSGGEQTIGFKYFLGVHAVLAQNKLRIIGLKFGEKLAWEGSKAGGETISVDNRELFGGKEAEGGVSGYIDVLNGDANQAKNSYLQTKIGGVISAYRGVTSLVFKQFYFGNNPYLKRMAIKGIDDEIADQWYPAKAKLNVDVSMVGAEVYIAMDVSGSMIGAKFTFMKNAVTGYLESLKGTVNSVRLVAFEENVAQTTTILNCTDADYDTLIAWVDGMAAPSGATSFAAGVSLAPAFFTTDTSTGFANDALLEGTGSTGQATAEGRTRALLFMTDGTPTDGQPDVDTALVTLNSLSGVDVYCFNIDEPDLQYTTQMDNTPADGVPVISSADSDLLLSSLQRSFISWADLNVAHILRDAIVYAYGDDSVVGDSFETFADTCYDENMGLSLVWKDTSTYNEFMDKIKAHADCVTYPDRTTGKIEVKAIRDDFDVGTLFVYDTSNVTKWHDDIAAPLQRKLPNQLTIVYTKREDGTTASITAANNAAVQQVGRIINTDPITYEGITTDDLAGKVLGRDLAARTVPLYSGAIDVTYAPDDLNLGSPFIIHNPTFGLNNLVVRLTSKVEIAGIIPLTTLEFIEDKFATQVVALIVPDAPVIVDKTPINSPHRRFDELGYYSLVISQTKATVDDLLAENPDYGVVALAGTKPNGYHTAMDSATDNGGGWLLVSSGGFAPASTLVSTINSAATTSFDVVDNDSLRQVVAGSLFVIDDEILRVDTMVISGDNVTLTVGRGCLDTVPTHHAVNAAVMFYDGYTQHDPTTYVAGETIDGKILTKTSTGRLSLDDATTENVTLNSRAIRPYPVGNLRMDGSFTPTGFLDETVEITWAHRDRQLQLTTAVEDYEDASIGPESGVSYELEVYARLVKDDFFAATDFFAQPDFFIADGDGTLIRSNTVHQDDSYTYNESGTYDFFAPVDFFAADDFFASSPIDFFSPADFFAQPDFFRTVTGRALQTRIKIVASRDGYDNWTDAVVDGKPLLPAINLTGVST